MAVRSVREENSCFLRGLCVPVIASVYRRVTAVMDFPMPSLLLLALQGECENLWNHRAKSLETDCLFPVLPWICVSAISSMYSKDARSFLNETASYLWFCGPGFFLLIILLKPQPLCFLWMTQRQTLSLNLWSRRYKLLSTWNSKSFTRDAPNNVAGYVFLLFI